MKIYSVVMSVLTVLFFSGCNEPKERLQLKLEKSTGCEFDVADGVEIFKGLRLYNDPKDISGAYIYYISSFDSSLNRKSLLNNRIDKLYKCTAHEYLYMEGFS